MEILTNAFIRRGYKAYATRGINLLHYRDAPGRGWSDAIPLPFYDQVEHEEDDD